MGRKKLVDMEKWSPKVGRPPIYQDDDVVRLSASGKSKLQPGSERRAIVNVIIEKRGVVTLKQLDEHFGYTVRSKVLSLQRAGWLIIEPIAKPAPEPEHLPSLGGEE